MICSYEQRENVIGINDGLLPPSETRPDSGRRIPVGLFVRRSTVDGATRSGKPAERRRRVHDVGDRGHRERCRQRRNMANPHTTLPSSCRSPVRGRHPTRAVWMTPARGNGTRSERHRREPRGAHRAAEIGRSPDVAHYLRRPSWRCPTHPITAGASAADRNRSCTRCSATLFTNNLPAIVGIASSSPPPAAVVAVRRLRLT